MSTEWWIPTGSQRHDWYTSLSTTRYILWQSPYHPMSALQCSYIYTVKIIYMWNVSVRRRVLWALLAVQLSAGRPWYRGRDRWLPVPGCWDEAPEHWSTHQTSHRWHDTVTTNMNRFNQSVKRFIRWPKLLNYCYVHRRQSVDVQQVVRKRLHEQMCSEEATKCGQWFCRCHIFQEVIPGLRAGDQKSSATNRR